MPAYRTQSDISGHKSNLLLAGGGNLLLASGADDVLLLHWPFIGDSSGNKKHGEMRNMVSLDRGNELPAQLNSNGFQSLDFSASGGDDHVLVAGHNLPSSPPWTIGGWMRTTAVSGKYAILATTATTDNWDEGVTLTVLPTGRVNYTIHWANAPISCQTSSAISNDTWTHIAGTWDSSDNKFRLFINGSLSVTSSSGQPSLSSPHNSNLYIGNDYNQLLGNDCKIADWRAWDVALSGSQLSDVMSGVGVGAPIMKYDFTL